MCIRDSSYGDQSVLENFNLDITEGEIVGIRGESGCGKSTLVNLMMYFMPADKGDILIDVYKRQAVPGLFVGCIVANLLSPNIVVLDLSLIHISTVFGVVLGSSPG